MSKNFVVRTTVDIFDKFKTIIKSGNYEKIILEIMNSSQKIFNGKYVHNKEQSHGECDFVNLINRKKYDAKLPFSKKQGKLIGSKKHDYYAWLITMIDEASEFDNIAGTREKIDVENLILYKTIKDRLNTVEKDENLILFFPFPILSCDAPNAVMLQFSRNILTVVFNALENNGLVNGRQIYAIYPCMSNYLAIRHLNKRVCEYVSSEPLKNYIDYNINIVGY